MHLYTSFVIVILTPVCNVCILLLKSPYIWRCIGDALVLFLLLFQKYSLLLFLWAVVKYFRFIPFWPNMVHPSTYSHSHTHTHAYSHIIPLYVKQTLSIQILFPIEFLTTPSHLRILLPCNAYHTTPYHTVRIYSLHYVYVVLCICSSKSCCCYIWFYTLRFVCRIGYVSYTWIVYTQMQMALCARST